MSGELLLGAGWEAIAHTELTRLKLSIAIYQKQLEGCAGYLELAKAVEAIDEACAAIVESTEHTEDEA